MIYYHKTYSSAKPQSCASEPLTQMAGGLACAPAACCSSRLSLSAPPIKEGMAQNSAESRVEWPQLAATPGAILGHMFCLIGEDERHGLALLCSRVAAIPGMIPH